jgi:hypothetical protein
MFQEYALDPNTLAFLLTIIAGFIFVLMAKDNDPTSISNKIKVAVVVGVGTLLGILYLFYLAAIPETAVKVSLVTIVKYVFGGFMMGASAIGINQVWKIFSQPTTPPVGGRRIAEKIESIKFKTDPAPPDSAPPAVGIIERVRASVKK